MDLPSPAPEWRHKQWLGRSMGQNEVQLALSALAPWSAPSLGSSFTIHHRHAIGHSHALSAAAPAGLVLSIMSNRWVVHLRRLSHYRAAKRGLSEHPMPFSAQWSSGKRWSLWFVHVIEMCTKWGVRKRVGPNVDTVILWYLLFSCSCSISYANCIAGYVISSLTLCYAYPRLSNNMNPVR